MIAKCTRRDALKLMALLSSLNTTIQLYGGQIAGIKAAVHATKQIATARTMFLVDATNVSNSLNCQAALHNIRLLCPVLATILINTYRISAQLFVNGCVLHSDGLSCHADVCDCPAPINAAGRKCSHTNLVH